LPPASDDKSEAALTEPPEDEGLAADCELAALTAPVAELSSNEKLIVKISPGWIISGI